MSKKLLSILLVLALLFSFIPIIALAAGEKYIITSDDDDKLNAITFVSTCVINGTLVTNSLASTSKEIRMNSYEGIKAFEINGVKTFLSALPNTATGIAQARQTAQEINFGSGITGTIKASLSSYATCKLYIQLSGVTASEGDIVIKFLFSEGDESTLSLTLAESANGSSEIKGCSANEYAITATPNLDYRFDHWERSTDGGSSWQTDAEATAQGATATVTIAQDTTYRAHFAVAGIKLGNPVILSKAGSLPAPMLSVKSNYPEGYTSFQPNSMILLANYPSAVVGSPVELIVGWYPTGTLKLSPSNSQGAALVPQADYGKYVNVSLYAGDSTSATPIYQSEDMILLHKGDVNSGGYRVLPRQLASAGDYHFVMYFTMPETANLTMKVELKDYAKNIISTDVKVIKTPFSDELNALSAQYDTLANLRWRFLIKEEIGKAASLIAKADESAIAGIVSQTRSNIEGYIAGTNKNYITVSFGGLDGGATSGNIVRVTDKVSQSEAFQAHLEQMYPREKGFWYLDCATSQFGLWVNGFGGRMFTAGELASKKLETAITTPSKMFAAGEPLPQSGVVLGSQKGGLTYLVNGFYANFGMTGWKCSDGDRFTWGLSAEAYDDGIPDWGEPGGEVWHSPIASLANQPQVAAVVAQLTALNNSSTKAQVEAARAAYNQINATIFDLFWNPAYARYLGAQDVFGDAYQNLAAQEIRIGLVAPLPSVTYTTALSGVLSKLSGKPAGTGSVGGEWVALSLARGGSITPAYKTAYLSAVDGESDEIPYYSMTDKERLVLGLTAVGENVSEYGNNAVKTLVANIENFNYASNMQTNIPTFALLALNSKPYVETSEYEELPSSLQNPINWLINNQYECGAWPVNASNGGSGADIDSTAMAVQALAPFYGKDSRITTAVDKAVDWMHTQQDSKTGGFKGFVPEGQEAVLSTCSTVQVIAALCELGRNPADWEVAGGWNPIYALLSHYDTANQGFGEANASYANDSNGNMATEQAAYALVAYDRLLNGKNTLYNMRDAFETVATPPDGNSATITAQQIAAGAPLTVTAGAATITLDAAAVASLPSGTAVTLTAKFDNEVSLTSEQSAITGTRTVVSLIAATASGDPITSFNGSVTVTFARALGTLPGLSIAEQSANAKVISITGAGVLTLIKTASWANDKITFSTNHFSDFVVDFTPWGDANGDGKVTNADVLLIYRGIGNTTLKGIAAIVADYNKSGSVTNADVLLVYKAIG